MSDDQFVSECLKSLRKLIAEQPGPIIMEPSNEGFVADKSGNERRWNSSKTTTLT